MPITLAEAKVGMADRVNQEVVDMFQRSSLLLDSLTFDNSISPGTGGSTLAYGYVQLQTPSTAGVRAINSEYTAGEAKRTKKTTEAIIMGGTFQLDRVIIGTAGAVDELVFQTEQKVLATSNEFHNLVINGSSASTDSGYVAGTFDGLRKMLTGSSTEVSSATSLTTSAEMDSNTNAFLDEIDTLLSLIDGTPSMLMMNTAMLTKLRSIARRAGYYERKKDDFGRVVETYNGIPMVDMGKYYNGTTTVPVISTSTATTSATGNTSIYAVTLGMNGLYGISPEGDKLISTFMPDLNLPGAVKTGEVELIAGVALRNTLSCAVLTGIPIEGKLPTT